MNDSLLKNLKIIGDSRGQLVALESNIEIPFDIKRVFYIYGTKEGINRGKHSHYTTKQFLVSVKGYCKITLDNGETKKTYDLNEPNLGLFQDKMIWGEMHDFSEDCVLMVLASEFYDEKDYIREYKKFIEEVKNGK